LRVIVFGNCPMNLRNPRSFLPLAARHWAIRTKISFWIGKNRA
jgi:hypothetical protein